MSELINGRAILKSDPPLATHFGLDEAPVPELQRILREVKTNVEGSLYKERHLGC
jgi:hypothetical protein